MSREARLLEIFNTSQGATETLPELNRLRRVMDYVITRFCEEECRLCRQICANDYDQCIYDCPCHKGESK